MLFYELWQLACCRQQLCVRVCSIVCVTVSEQHFEHLKIVYTFNSLCPLWWWPAGDTDRFCNDLRSLPWTLGGMVLFLSALSLIIVTTVGHESFNKFTLCCLVLWHTYYPPFCTPNEDTGNRLPPSVGSSVPNHPVSDLHAHCHEMLSL